MGCVDRITGNGPVSYLTDVSALVRFSISAILTCLIIESPIRMVCGSAGVELPICCLALLSGALVMFLSSLGLAVVLGLFLCFVSLDQGGVICFFLCST